MEVEPEGRTKSTGDSGNAGQECEGQSQRSEVSSQNFSHSHDIAALCFRKILLTAAWRTVWSE